MHEYEKYKLKAKKLLSVQEAFLVGKAQNSNILFEVVAGQGKSQIFRRFKHLFSKTIIQ